MDSIKQIFKNDILSNIELYELARLCKIDIVVLMKDELNADILFKHKYFILNLQNSDQPGSHWVSMFRHNKSIYFCDSYGLILPQNQVDLFKKLNLKCYYNTSQFQDLKSNVCGYFSLHFLLYMRDAKNKHDSFSKYPYIFYLQKDTLNFNNKLVKRFVAKYIVDKQNKLTKKY